MARFEKMTIGEVVNTPEFKAELKAVIEETSKGYAIARAKAINSGTRLKNSPFARLENKGLMTPDKVLQEYDLMTEKKSKLKKTERDMVDSVIWYTFMRVMGRDKKDKEKTDLK